MKITKTTSRKFEKIIGCIGSILGIISSFLVFIFTGIGFHTMTLLGFLAIIGSILGFIATYLVEDKEDEAGVIFIVVSILLILHSGAVG